MKSGISKAAGPILCFTINLICSSQAQAVELTQATTTDTAKKPSYSKPIVIKAYTHIRKGKYQDAIEVLKPSLKADPKNVETHRYLAYSYMQIGRPADALSSATKVVECGIEHPHDAVTLGEAQFYTGKPKEAIEFYREALLLNPLHIDARAGVIRCLMALGRFHEAKAICKQAAYGYQGENGKTYFRKMLREIDSKTQIASRTIGS
jgi:Flp pilus assembly protein TadD